MFILIGFIFSLSLFLINAWILKKKLKVLKAEMKNTENAIHRYYVKILTIRHRFNYGK